MKLKNTQYESMEKLNCVCKIGRKWIEKRISELMGMVPWQEQALYQMCIYSRTQELITQYSLFSILKICLNIVSKYWIPISTIFFTIMQFWIPLHSNLKQMNTNFHHNRRKLQIWAGVARMDIVLPDYNLRQYCEMYKMAGRKATSQTWRASGRTGEPWKSSAVCKPKSFFKQNRLPLPPECSGLFAQRPCPAQGKALTHSWGIKLMVNRI